MSSITPAEALRLQDSFAQKIAQELPRGWESYRIHYENYQSMQGPLEQYTCSYTPLQSSPVDFDPSLDAIDILVSLQQAMQVLGSGAWTHLECEINTSGKYKFDYKYGVPPLAAQTLRLSNGDA